MTLEAKLSYSKVGPDSLMLHFVVENTGNAAEKVTFRSGQRYDYILYRDGVRVEKFSEGKMFTMIYEEIAVNAGQELSFDIPLNNLKPGRHKIIVWLADADWPTVRATLEFDV
ncbi:BsuPI-related putative proteinase inhibitor [Sutcliffiella rhizosphaerae]|uniref:Intracellular proteinase inhibitor BsuPI domain-containing protein n=1 Tax=Sutcliffiella rhizosphaerae TaxID=2880967 RepID=A0ABN8A8Q7_9BACI|nr:BsuPI-related putative proteinase inhibitor [Sutcliffiella rhizosphaerae]CAG9620181.1 hypothetical protein BACCIP111883_00949 [Sutcliffiella rhizosphaerae]